MKLETWASCEWPYNPEFQPECYYSKYKWINVYVFWEERWKCWCYVVSAGRNHDLSHSGIASYLGLEQAFEYVRSWFAKEEAWCAI